MSKLHEKMIRAMELKNLSKHTHIDYRARKKVRKLPCVLTQQQIWSIICAPKNPKHRLTLMTTYSAGLRVSELIALQPGHIEFVKCAEAR